MDTILGKISLEDSKEHIELLGKKNYVWEYGAKVYSQNGEDGIVYYLLSQIPDKNKIAVEIGAGDGLECNTGYLVRKEGYTSYFLDGSPYWLEQGVHAYQNFTDCKGKPRFICSWITKENIIETLDSYQVPKEIDILSMDIDGNDYWILQEILSKQRLDPKVIVLEYQDILGPHRTLSIPYNPYFNHRNYDCWNGPNYCGASLKAFIYLLSKQYAFVGCEEKGFNGFFVKREYVTDTLQEMKDITPCFQSEKVRFGMEQRYSRTSHLPWVDVTKNTSNI
jgi:hypothetical protein